MAEPRRDPRELRFVLDAQQRIADVVGVLASVPTQDLRGWLDHPFVEVFEADERERVETALREAAGGRTAELGAARLLGGPRADYELTVSVGARFSHVVLRASAGPRSRISHDFKNLLAAILVNAEFLRRDDPELETMHEVADEILEAAQGARELIEQILEYSAAKVERGR